MRSNRVAILFGLACVLLFSLGANEDGLKIAIVDLEQALASTEEGKAAREEMGRKQREAEQKVQPMVDRFNGMKEELQAKKFVLSDESLFQKQLDLARTRASR
jgi:Skp family chaperone for outer membrane proteins